MGDVEELGFSATDEEIAAYACRTDRLVLTQDDDFITDVADEEGPGVLFQTDGTLSGREVGDIVHELSEYVAQERIDLEYVSRNWL